MSDQPTPERGPLHTFDVDSAFDRLTTDIEGRSSASGAERAIRSGARRRTAVAGTLAVAVLALGGVVANSVDRTGVQQVQPAAPQSTAVPLPAPKAFTTAELEAATAGWLSGWQRGDSPVLTDPPCIDDAENLPQPKGGTATEYRIGSSTGASVLFGTFASDAAARSAYDTLVAGTLGCHPTAVDHPGERTGLTATFGYFAKADHTKASMAVWYVLVDDHLVILTVAKPDREPSAAVSETVARALYAGALS